MGKTIRKLSYVTGRPHSGKCTQDAIRGLPSGAVVKNPPADARDMGLRPGLGRFHVLWSD